MTKKTVSIALCAGLIACALFGIFLLREKAPLKIGYVADLGSELGIAGRNGVSLALDEVNAKGGLAGRRVELLSRNNLHNQHQAWEAVRDLVDQGVVAIIGHMTSEMSFSTIDLVNQAGVVMISPTNSSDLLSRRDDQFLRIYPAASRMTQKLAKYAARRDLKKFAILADQSNYAFSKSWTDSFKKDLQQAGGDVVEVIPFDGRNMQTGFLTLVQQVAEACVDGVLVLANPMHAALIIQQFDKVECNARLFVTEWSYSPSLLDFGGKKALELTIVQTYMPGALDQKSNSLQNRLKEKLNQEATFASAHAYDAARLIVEALQKNGNAGQLKETLLSLGVVEGVQSPIRFDRYGDVDRIHYVRQLADGKLATVAQF